MLNKSLLTLLILFFIGLPFSYSQDTLCLSGNEESWFANSEYIGGFQIPQNDFVPESLELYKYKQWQDSIRFSGDYDGTLNIFRVILKNELNEKVEIGISGNISHRSRIFFISSTGDKIEPDLLNIRGRDIYGKIRIETNEVTAIYILLQTNQFLSGDRGRVLNLEIHNFDKLLSRELNSRFIHALLLGLLLFSAVLNLILGIILQRKSHVSLFFYLMSLLLFAFSYLGFYDEFFGSNKIHFPISLPVYFLTLILFLQVSKRYLQLEKNLPGWNTMTNLIMFFLALSIPYYYLTVYVDRFFNNFLAFSSLFVFVVAALMGLIEAVILFKKEPKAKYFLIANLIVVVSLAINLFLGNKYPVVVGSVLQGFIFTIGLAEEIKILDQQKLRFQQSLIGQLEVNLKLKEDQTVVLENKVSERTKELKKANNELTEKNNIVHQQKELLEFRSKEIKDSIEYAKRIQNASFPPRKILETIASDYFIFYKPRDIVSGDFYWFGEVDEKVIIIAADSTGHGVPGAFMSMFGIAFLNEIVNKEKIFYPNEILDTLRERIAGSLNRADDEFETMDGMDMSVLTIDAENSKIYYSGAFNSLYFIRNEVLQIVEADKMPVAFYQKMDPFTLHTLELFKGDSFYIFTDGLIDQFGGPKGKKFLNKQLKEIIMEISHLPMEEQHKQVSQAFSEWRGNYFQVDDVLMIGFKF
ncbi:MAG: SpoIIE family protein phosphatase [Bacteroidales bacterium]|nr:SpoIIE family protein phosphatase [Bacteroidales bacterium]